MAIVYKYRPRSISELFDKCTSLEWADIVYVCGFDIYKHLNLALELFNKDSLELQKRNRWQWLINDANCHIEQCGELARLLNRNNIDVTEFVKCIFNVLNCIDEKKNCLRLIGIPNSGKTLIAQLICQKFLCAYVNNHNSENEFYLSCFLNKSICLCEELMITPATAEDFKSILGGMPLLISKKYNEKQVLARTPIIVTSNHEKFGRGHLNPADEEALSKRCYTFYFNHIVKPECHIDVESFSHMMYVHHPEIQ